jgi:RNA polymerase sigma-70 factor (ECF subfamily)
MMTAEGKAVGTVGIGGWVASDLVQTDARSSVSLANFERWMAGEQRRIFLLCLRMLRNREDADIATQDSFLKAFQALRKGGTEPIGAPEKWVTRIAVNTCLDRLRSKRWSFWRRQALYAGDGPLLELVPGARPDAEAALHARDIARRLSAALDKLSLRQRAVFVLRHDEDRSLEEIGELLGLDLGTVKSHMSRALTKLREELRDLYE